MQLASGPQAHGQFAQHARGGAVDGDQLPQHNRGLLDVLESHLELTQLPLRLAQVPERIRQLAPTVGVVFRDLEGTRHFLQATPEQHSALLPLSSRRRRAAGSILFGLDSELDEDIAEVHLIVVVHRRERLAPQLQVPLSELLDPSTATAHAGRVLGNVREIQQREGAGQIHVGFRFVTGQLQHALSEGHVHQVQLPNILPVSLQEQIEGKPLEAIRQLCEQIRLFRGGAKDRRDELLDARPVMIVPLQVAHDLSGHAAGIPKKIFHARTRTVENLSNEALPADVIRSLGNLGGLGDEPPLHQVVKGVTRRLAHGRTRWLIVRQVSPTFKDGLFFCRELSVQGPSLGRLRRPSLR